MGDRDAWACAIRVLAGEALVIQGRKRPDKGDRAPDMAL
jgi:hypothetical protein